MDEKAQNYHVKIIYSVEYILFDNKVSNLNIVYQYLLYKTIDFYNTSINLQTK